MHLPSELQYPRILHCMKKSWVFVAFLLTAGGSRVLVSQTVAGTPTQDVRASVEGLVKIQRVWGPLTSTPNMSLTLTESSRSGDGIRMSLHTAGLPAGKTYSLVSWPVTEKNPVTLMDGVTVDSSGIAICAGSAGMCKGDKPNDPINLVLRPVAGEPVRLALISGDESIKVFANTVPIPLRGTDQGCTIDAVLLTPGAELVWIEASGFRPNSTLTVSSSSGGEVRGEDKRANADGSFRTAILPYVEGLSHGVVTVTLKSAKCSPSVKVPWGHSQ
jgi:hypothetical protein